MMSSSEMVSGFWRTRSMVTRTKQSASIQSPQPRIQGQILELRLTLRTVSKYPIAGDNQKPVLKQKMGHKPRIGPRLGPRIVRWVGP